LFQLLDAIIDN